ncbi:HEPN domain-containing protein [Enterobacter hormaechei]|uniref:HEPN domain-containing protein n=1 Tax=Enterobacter hormaechei TaxID=158836 RepID=UPI000735CDC0|nr:HEPN domain-containing protein [Enterobacter hormaechei]KTI34495.1 hypothetical protein ASV05_15025 [Enterobacter hormaechei subsp. xiangfangensis]KTJ89422.1 hypothetical protein ASU73_03825 [Enterobacter hormaechei subsp. xiangfangensis]
MNDRYIDYSNISNFPDEAFDMAFRVDGPVEFDDTWLTSASKEDQHDAVEAWFTDRFCSPTNDTPYNGREGGHQYIHGGPYNAESEIFKRFDGIIPEDTLQEVIYELERENGSEWAPVNHNQETDYDDYFNVYTNSRWEARSNLIESLKEIELFLNQQDEISGSKKLAYQMAYGMMISCFEAYLSEVVLYWARENVQTLYRIASKIDDFSEKKYKLFDVLLNVDSFPVEMLNYLTSKVVWHRLDKLKPIIEFGLNITIPNPELIMKAIQTRHDIVHRAGKNTDGVVVHITKELLNDLSSGILEFVCKFEEELEREYPLNDKDFDDDVVL